MIKITNNPEATNKYKLLESKSDDIRSEYERVFSNIEGSLSVVADNDSATKINIACVSLSPSRFQLNCLESIKRAFVQIESAIDPERLNFIIEKAFDDEICITRKSSGSLKKIIIHEEEILALSIISKLDSFDALNFYEIQDNFDFEKLAYDFLS